MSDSSVRWSLRAINPEIVVLTPDLSKNAVGRALVLVNLLRHDRKVTLAGRATGARWAPLNARHEVPILELPRGLRAARRALAQGHPHATILASKPLLSSYGIALAMSHHPVILDIDDPEIGLATADLRTMLSALKGAENPLLTRVLIGLRGRASRISVANELLRRQYGGAVIPHARDQGWFTEHVRSRARARRQLGLPNSLRLIVFVGTVRSHKGVIDLLEAHRSLPSTTLAIVGSQSSVSEAGVIRVPPVDYPTAMDWVAAADIVVVPQRDTRVGRQQSPAKLVDAMAMGRAIVATDLAPIIEMVGNAAEIVPPSSPSALVAAITRLFDDRLRRETLEALARSRFLGTLSEEAVRPRMMQLINEAEAVDQTRSYGTW